jgi:hypothetical protein
VFRNSKFFTFGCFLSGPSLLYEIPIIFLVVFRMPGTRRRRAIHTLGNILSAVGACDTVIFHLKVWIDFTLTTDFYYKVVAFER